MQISNYGRAAQIADVVNNQLSTWRFIIANKAWPDENAYHPFDRENPISVADIFTWLGTDTVSITYEGLTDYDTKNTAQGAYTFAYKDKYYKIAIAKTVTGSSLLSAIVDYSGSNSGKFPGGICLTIKVERTTSTNTSFNQVAFRVGSDNTKVVMGENLLPQVLGSGTLTMRLIIHF